MDRIQDMSSAELDRVRGGFDDEVRDWLGRTAPIVNGTALGGLAGGVIWGALARSGHRFVAAGKGLTAGAIVGNFLGDVQVVRDRAARRAAHSD